MKDYVGVLHVRAVEMCRGAYHKYQRMATPEYLGEVSPGLLVEVTEPEAENTQNHPAHDGYVFWMPKDLFHRAFSRVGSSGVSRKK